MDNKKDKIKRERNAHDVRIVAWISVAICVTIGLITTKDVACLWAFLLVLFLH